MYICRKHSRKTFLSITFIYTCMWTTATRWRSMYK